MRPVTLCIDGYQDSEAEPAAHESLLFVTS
jgi:hypothetical protein